MSPSPGHDDDPGESTNADGLIAIVWIAEYRAGD
jgi:hypothetical protein